MADSGSNHGIHHRLKRVQRFRILMQALEAGKSKTKCSKDSFAVPSALTFIAPFILLADHANPDKSISWGSIVTQEDRWKAARFRRDHLSGDTNNDLLCVDIYFDECANILERNDNASLPLRHAVACDLKSYIERQSRSSGVLRVFAKTNLANFIRPDVVHSLAVEAFNAPPSDVPVVERVKLAKVVLPDAGQKLIWVQQELKQLAAPVELSDVMARQALLVELKGIKESMPKMCTGHPKVERELADDLRHLLRMLHSKEKVLQ